MGKEAGLECQLTEGERTLLAALPLSELRSRAEASGISPAVYGQAIDRAGDAKTALIDLIVAASDVKDGHLVSGCVCSCRTPRNTTTLVPSFAFTSAATWSRSCAAAFVLSIAALV